MGCTVGGAVRPGYIPGVSSFGLVCGGVWIASEYCVAVDVWLHLNWVVIRVIAMYFPPPRKQWAVPKS